MKSKSKIWLILWFISMLIGTAISFGYQLQYSLQTGSIPPKNAILADPGSLLAQVQTVLLLIYLPIVTLPLLGCTYYHAKREGKKVLHIFSAVMIVFILFSIIITFIQWLGVTTGGGFA